MAKNSKHTQKEMNVIYHDYIMDCVKRTAEINNDYGMEISDTPQERLKVVIDCFNSEVNHEYEKRNTPQLTGRIANWFMGLPSAISIDFENYKILELCKQWGVIEENASEKKEDKYLEHWYICMANQLLKVCTKYKVDYSHLY